MNINSVLLPSAYDLWPLTFAGHLWWERNRYGKRHAWRLEKNRRAGSAIVSLQHYSLKMCAVIIPCYHCWVSNNSHMLCNKSHIDISPEPLCVWMWHLPSGWSKIQNSSLILHDLNQTNGAFNNKETGLFLYCRVVSPSLIRKHTSIWSLRYSR